MLGFIEFEAGVWGHDFSRFRYGFDAEGLAGIKLIGRVDGGLLRVASSSFVAMLQDCR